VGGQCGPVGTSSLTAHLPDDLYARWVALGTFQPLDRLHSDHGDRLPWSYGAEAEAAATSFLQLREALVPYLYSLAGQAHDTGLPMTRGLYIEWPDLDAAYQHPSEYLLGRDVVVAPVIAPGDPAPATVWVPPGTWVDYFTREVLHGPAVVHEQVPLSRMPVLVRPRALGKLPPLR
jgi:alpha-glucosidase (family GH31 glycosyl hydrolase)